MTFRYSTSIVTAVIAVVFLAAPAVHATLDSPALSLEAAGHAKQTIMVTAGTSGAPDGFTIWWMDEATYNANGGTWPSSPIPGMGHASFTGTPELNTWGGMYSSFSLGSGESMRIEIGDLFDESGVSGMVGELEYGKTYYFVGFANDAQGAPASVASPTIQGQTTESMNCTYTQGYWKTHEEVWPVGSLTLGTVVYTQAELLLILNQSVMGNGLVSLAHQLIAAKLNLANGADDAAVIAAINAADAMIGALVVPPIGAGYLAPGTTSMTTQTMDDYNNGIIGPGHCGGVPAEQKSMGNIKTLFR